VTREQLRDRIATVLDVRRSVAVRVVRWLRERLHDGLGIVHGEAGVVPFRSGDDSVGVLVATVDYTTQEVGCAWCGLYAASHRTPLEAGTRAVMLGADLLPHELADLRLRPAVLYCAECWPTIGDFVRQRLGLEPGES